MSTKIEDRTRELQFADESDEQRWLDAAFAQLDAEAGPPPF